MTRYRHDDRTVRRVISPYHLEKRFSQPTASRKVRETSIRPHSRETRRVEETSFLYFIF